MQKEFKNLLNILFAFAIVLLFFTIIRLYFYFSNQQIFAFNINLFPTFLYGIYYDIRFVLLINTFVLFLFFFPFRIRNTVFWQAIVKVLFLFINFSVLMFYLMSAKFYNQLAPYFLSLSESNDFIHDLFKIFGKINFSFTNTWDFILFSAFSFIVLFFVFPSINNMYFERSKKNKQVRYLLSILILLFFLLGIYEHRFRTEKWQTSLYNKVNKTNAILTINSSYQLAHLYLAKKEKIPKKINSLLPTDIFTIKKAYKSASKAKVNFILTNIYLEQFSVDEFTKVLKSLGINFYAVDNFYAPKKMKLLQTDELLLSYPAFISKILYQTKFAFNKIQSLAAILSENNYRTVLLSNRMDNQQTETIKNYYGFDKLIVGTDLTSSLTQLSEYLNGQNRHYFVFFNLKNSFTDFFDFLSQEYFNENTFIIINIKHRSEKDFAFGKTFFLQPEHLYKSAYKHDTITDLDIFPSAIDYLGIENSFIAFGKSIFKNHEKELFQYTGKDYILLSDSLLFRYNGSSTKWLVNYRKDPDEYFDLQDQYPVQTIRMENKIRAIIQKYIKQLNNY